MSGIKYGLVLGIFGNFVVQYSFPLFEGVLLSRYDSVFFGSLLVILISTLVIAYVLNNFRKEQKKRKNDWV